MPLATEYAVRLVHLTPDIGAEDLAGFFGFGAPETQVLVQDMLETQLVTERDGKFSLSTKGREAVSPMSDDIELFEVDEINAIQCFDLIAFAPVDDADLNAAEARRVPEITIPNRERAAGAAVEARQAFETHFAEWYQRNDRRKRIEDIRLHAVDDVQPLRTFGAPLHFPVRYRLDDPASIEADFGFLRNKGRPASRNALIEALSTTIQGLSSPPDHADGFDWLNRVDAGLLGRSGLRGYKDQATWARLPVGLGGSGCLYEPGNSFAQDAAAKPTFPSHVSKCLFR
jgi:hypothetical protein